MCTIDVWKRAERESSRLVFSRISHSREKIRKKIVYLTDERTGPLIYSLYGETRRPKPEQLKDLDAIVYDIRDIGTPAPTFPPCTWWMEEAAKAENLASFLDRPELINLCDATAHRRLMEGPNLRRHAIPVRHGMTTGEIACRYPTPRKKNNADLRDKMETGGARWWFGPELDADELVAKYMRSFKPKRRFTRNCHWKHKFVGYARIRWMALDWWPEGHVLKEQSGAFLVPINGPNALGRQEVGGINIVITDRETFEPDSALALKCRFMRNFIWPDWKNGKLSALIVTAEFWVSKQGDAPKKSTRV